MKPRPIRVRNWHAVNARVRRAGAMKHRCTPRGGARNSQRDLREQEEE